MIALTPRQAQLVRFVAAERLHGREPSLGQIGEALKLSRGAACVLRQRVAERLGDPRMPIMVRDRAGQAFQFVPVSALPQVAGNSHAG
ncbi:hypothetical protein BH09PSE4_BH09PSE4_13880 [soil metagenome]